MSVIYKNDLGAFLDYLPLTSYSLLLQNQNETMNGVLASERSLLSNGSYSAEGQDEKVKACYRWKKELFAVDSPFMMNSQAERLKREAVNIESGEVIKETSAQRKRRKKSQREIVLSEFEKKISTVISTALPCLVEQARELKCIHKIPSHPSENNQSAREASQIAGCGNLFPNVCWEFDEDSCCTSSRVIGGGGDNVVKTDSHNSSDMIVLNEECDLSYRSSSIIGRRVCNLDDGVKVIQVDSHKFLIPAKSSFITSSFHQFVAEGYKQTQVENGFHLIVLDPPWNNKSVKRKKSYHTVDEAEFREIPIQELAADDCLICVWVTNNERLKFFVTEDLFPHWSVHFLTEWIWLKVTRGGEPVCDVLSAHKKPYEQLIIGRFTRHQKYPAIEACGVADVGSSNVHEKSTNCRSPHGKLPDVPLDFLLASVPCSLHSKKPSLADVLSEYLPNNPCCLELFARNLTPGWISWGMEPLVHQHVDYFEQVR
ncbi:hypothetical protein BsWGS_02478 [Bradybaena similaris]